MTSVSITAEGVCGRGVGGREQWAGECNAFHFLGSTDSDTQRTGKEFVPCGQERAGYRKEKAKLGGEIFFGDFFLCCFIGC